MAFWSEPLLKARRKSHSRDLPPPGPGTRRLRHLRAGIVLRNTAMLEEEDSQATRTTADPLTKVRRLIAGISERFTNSAGRFCTAPADLATQKSVSERNGCPAFRTANAGHDSSPINGHIMVVGANLMQRSLIPLQGFHTAHVELARDHQPIQLGEGLIDRPRFLVGAA